MNTIGNFKPATQWVNSGNRIPPAQRQEIPVTERFTPSVVGEPAMPKFAPKLGAFCRSAMLTSCLAVGSMLAASCLPAHAAGFAVAEQSKDGGKAMDKGVDDALNATAGANFKDVGPQCVKTENTCKADYAKLTPHAQELYLKMPVSVKTMMDHQINAKTKFMGITILDHKNAFVQGQAFGQNTFDYVEKKVDEKVQGGKLKASEGAATHDFMEECRRMSQDQRQSLLNIITEDSHLAGK